MTECSYCNNDIPEDSTFCPYCGEQLPEEFYERVEYERRLREEELERALIIHGIG